MCLVREGDTEEQAVSIKKLLITWYFETFDTDIFYIFDGYKLLVQICDADGKPMTRWYQVESPENINDNALVQVEYDELEW